MKGPLLLALAAASAAPEQRGGTYLASIAGIALGPGEFVDEFHIDTWGVDIIAICRIPPGWQIRAGRTATPDGIIAGEASHGVTFLAADDLGALQRMVLVGLREPPREAAGTLPATFAGRARIGGYGIDMGGREVALGNANLRLEPARSCR